MDDKLNYSIGEEQSKNMQVGGRVSIVTLNNLEFINKQATKKGRKVNVMTLKRNEKFLAWDCLLSKLTKMKHLLNEVTQWQVIGMLD